LYQIYTFILGFQAIQYAVRFVYALQTTATPPLNNINYLAVRKCSRC